MGVFSIIFESSTFSNAIIGQSSSNKRTHRYAHIDTQTLVLQSSSSLEVEVFSWNTREAILLEFPNPGGLLFSVWRSQNSIQTTWQSVCSALTMFFCVCIWFVTFWIWSLYAWFLDESYSCSSWFGRLFLPFILFIFFFKQRHSGSQTVFSSVPSHICKNTNQALCRCYDTFCFLVNKCWNPIYQVCGASGEYLLCGLKYDAYLSLLWACLQQWLGIVSLL